MIKSNKIVKIALPIFICFIMITSILGYMNSSNSEKIKYKDYKFYKIEDKFIGYVGDVKVILMNNPNGLDSYRSKIKLTDLNEAQKIYLSLNPKDSLFLGTLENNIFPFLVSKVVISCYEDNEECVSSPLKTCTDASQEIKVILIKKDKNSKFYYKDNCLIIQGNQEEINKMIDGLTLGLLFK